MFFVDSSENVSLEGSDWEELPVRYEPEDQSEFEDAVLSKGYVGGIAWLRGKGLRLTNRAVDTLDQLMERDVPAGVRAEAAKTVIRISMGEMSSVQLPDEKFAQMLMEAVAMEVDGDTLRRIGDRVAKAVQNIQGRA